VLFRSEKDFRPAPAKRAGRTKARRLPVLVLTRKENESIMVGDQIEIVITKVENDRVKVGIKAPLFISVHRKEVYDDIRKENVEAVKIDMAALQQASQFLQKKKKEQ
jgi:carbon storage regulator